MENNAGSSRTSAAIVDSETKKKVGKTSGPHTGGLLHIYTGREPGKSGEQKQNVTLC